MKRNQNHYRQGDVGIALIQSIPENLKSIKPVNGLFILAYGEATGHHHSVSVLEHQDLEFYETGDGSFVLRAPSGVIVRHQEHAHITLPPGDYQIEHQVEYDPETEFRRVAD